ncbi:MAG TPA: glycosyltransferase family A protein [Flavobacterium sp.]|uniref:glycosyltransferase family 2 protein n=1 Tax=unclassified Flavobacterium TaxID=196869 RepID=UPI0025C5855E|nr:MULTISPECIES: glycosyltransferase family A protein [unclassified Flavobacterium]HRE77335.1 glycosyltransferase family A protein [Flavobacterium sp.]
MKSITVFTPTYNRAYCLHQLYESLVNQTNKDFIWLVIDDGSIDNTKELIDAWQKENKIDIEYIYKENGGMHTGHNVAYAHITTELNVCIDSDDFLPSDSIDIILNYWKENKSESLAGMIGLDAFKNGEIVGTPFPPDMKECKYFELKSRYNVVGDKKFVYRTDVIKKYPEYPVFSDERFVPLGYKYLLIDQDYNLGVIHNVLCIVEYMPDGSSKNIFKQYRKNPKGFAFERKIRMKYSSTLKERFMNSIHYVSCSIFIKNASFLSDSTNKLLTFFAIPFGIALHLYVRYTTKTGVMK